MSVSRAAAITAAFVKDGVRKTSARKLVKSSRDRDLFRWVKLPWEPYEVNIPLIKRRSADKEVVDEKVGILLPTDLLGHCTRRMLSVYASLGILASRACSHIGNPKIRIG